MRKTWVMFIRRKFDKLLVVAVVAGLFLYASVRAEFRVRTEMPPEFVDRSNATPANDPGLEQETARAYWNCAVTEIQWKYGYGYQLPPAPPPEFTVKLKGAADAATRGRYWHRLQQVWFLPSTWTKEYKWDFAWLRNPLAAAGDWWQEQLRKLSI